MRKTGEKARPGPSPTPCGYAAQVVAERMERMLAHAGGVRQGEDPEDVHQMRVWSRRTRAALDIFESCFEEKGFRRVEREVRTVTRALGQARDLDVMIEALDKRSEKLPDAERAGVDDYIAHLRAERGGAQDSVASVMTHLQEWDLLRRFAAVAADSDGREPEPLRRKDRRSGKDGKARRTTGDGGDPLLAFAADRIEARLDAVIEYAPYLKQPEAVFEHHEMRIAAKRLRYTLEIFEPVYDSRTENGKPYRDFIASVRDIQEHLGNIHDADVLIPQLTGYLARMLRAGYGVTSKGDPVVGVHRVNFAGCAGLLTLCRERQAERDAEFAALARAWEQLAEDGAFDRVRGLLRPAPTPAAPASAAPAPRAKTPAVKETRPDAEPVANGAQPRRRRRSARADTN